MNDAGIWAAPLLLIPAVGLLVLSTSARFGQLHEEFHRHRGEKDSRALKHLYRRARLIHSALVSFYISVAVLALASLLGTLSGRWLESLTWIPQAMTFVGVAMILFSAIQLIRESRLLMTVILDEADGNSTT
jgi:ABC-type spermidine/putrescine transport system permease subunit II